MCLYFQLSYGNLSERLLLSQAMLKIFEKIQSMPGECVGLPFFYAEENLTTSFVNSFSITYEKETRTLYYLLK